MGNRNHYDLTGMKFGRLTVIGRSSKKSKYGALWDCVCECGCPKSATTKELRKGYTKSCGFYPCTRRKNVVKFYKHFVALIDSKQNKILVDIEDYDKIKDVYWESNDKGYASAFIGGKQVLLHRLIMDAPDTLVVDHINHKTLDNRKHNLRICTVAQNNMNKRYVKYGKYGAAGIAYNEKSQKWSVEIGFNKKQILIGYFSTLDEAIDARKDAEKRYYGEFANKY